MMIRVILFLLLPYTCINGQGFQSSIAPNWGQLVGSAANQERLLESLINRGWTPPPDVQRELATATRARQTVSGADGFGNRFDFGFTPEQLTAPGLSIEDLIPINNGDRLGIGRDPAAANSLASLPNNVQIPGSLTRGLVNRGLMDPLLVNPNLGGRGLIDPTLQGTGFIDPTLQGRGLTGPSLLETAPLGRQRVPGIPNIISDGGLLRSGLSSLGPGIDPVGLGPLGPRIDPLDPIGPGVIGIAGHDRHGHDRHGHDDQHGIEVVKNKLAENKIVKKKLKKELRARKQIKKEKKMKKILAGKIGIGHTNGKIVAHGDHIHLDDKILKVVGTTHTHHPPPRNRIVRKNPINDLLTGLIIGGLGALLGGK